MKSVKSLSFFTNDDDKENRFDPWMAAANDPKKIANVFIFKRFSWLAAWILMI